MSNPMISTGGHESVKLTLMLRFRRGANQTAHVETFWRYGNRTNVALCGKEMTDERTLSSFPLGSDKAAEFWDIVCQGCKSAMDKLS